MVTRPIRRTVLPALALLLGLAIAAAPASAEIFSCPRGDGTTEYRDRPCGAGAAPASGARGAATTAPGSADVDPRKVRKLPRATDEPERKPAPAVPAFVSPTTPRSTDVDSSVDRTPSPPGTRADYVARNAALCRDGDRRACAAVTCDRSGDLASPACQEAVGYVKGRGWDLRPVGDHFDASRDRDDYTLTCRSTGRRAALSRARGSDMFDWPGGPAPAVARDVLPDAAREFCGTR